MFPVAMSLTCVHAQSVFLSDKTRYLQKQLEAAHSEGMTPVGVKGAVPDQKAREPRGEHLPSSSLL